MGEHLPRDNDDQVIQALSLKTDGSHKIEAGQTSDRSGELSSKVVFLYATEAVYLRFGDATVTATATDHYFPKGVWFGFALKNIEDAHTHIAALAVDADAVLYISEAS